MAETTEQKPRKKAGRKPRAKDNTLTRRELAVAVHKKIGGRRCPATLALEVVEKMIECMSEAMLQGRYIEFRDFGVFEVLTRKARLGRNPNDPDKTVIIPARKTVKFKLSRKLLAQLGDPSVKIVEPAK